MSAMDTHCQVLCCCTSNNRKVWSALFLWYNWIFFSFFTCNEYYIYISYYIICGIRKGCSVPTNTPSSQGKAKSHESKALNETMLPMRRKKRITISHSNTPIPSPISTKEKEWGREKKRRPTPGVRKSKQREKNGRKVKRKQIN